MSRTPLLSLRGLRSWFQTPRGAVQAVQDVSLDVHDGEAVGIVGESGSGKTQTFLSTFSLAVGAPGVVGGEADFDGKALLAGLSDAVRITRDADGTVLDARVAERWRRGHRERARAILGTDVALLSQDPKRSLIPYWTVRHHLAAVLRRKHPATEVEALARALLVQLGFTRAERILDSFPAQLSGGEAQRVMLALTMAIQPKLLIADEPTTALDALNQQRVLVEIQRMRTDRQQGLVLISHDVSLVERLTERVVVMYGGRVMERAPSSVLAEADAHRLHPYTEALRASHRRRAEGRTVAAVGGAEPARRAGQGCVFAPRCDLHARLPKAASSRCLSEAPPEIEVAPGHQVACWETQA